MKNLYLLFKNKEDKILWGYTLLAHIQLTQSQNGEKIDMENLIRVNQERHSSLLKYVDNLSRKSKPAVAQLIQEQIEANYRLTVAALEKAAENDDFEEKKAEVSDLVTSN